MSKEEVFVTNESLRNKILYKVCNDYHGNLNILEEFTNDFKVIVDQAITSALELDKKPHGVLQTNLQHHRAIVNRAAKVIAQLTGPYWPYRTENDQPFLVKTLMTILILQK